MLLRVRSQRLWLRPMTTSRAPFPAAIMLAKEVFTSGLEAAASRVLAVVNGPSRCGATSR